MNRTEYEKKVVRTMIGLYCKKKHKYSGGLCPECEDLMSYCEKRADNCLMGEAKTTCQTCKIHCYTRDYREKIRKVMRFSGARMLIYHPFMTLKHLYYMIRK